jgi:hypothetical protein
MKINDFLESEIRSKILSKAKPQEINKNTPHWKGYIYSGGKLVTKVKIPNTRNAKNMLFWHATRNIKNDMEGNDESSCFISKRILEVSRMW